MEPTDRPHGDAPRAPLPHADILARYHHGDAEGGFALLADRFAPQVRRITEARLRRFRGWSRLWDAREDIAQDALLRLHRGLTRPDAAARVTNLEGWVGQCIDWEIWDARRGLRRQDDRESPLDEGAEPAADEDPSFAEAEDLARALAQLRACLARLGERPREILRRWMGGETLAATAAAVGMKGFGGAAKARDRAFAALRECMQRSQMPGDAK